MMKVSEFKEYLNERKPHKIIFMSENQDEFEVADPLVLSMTFSSMVVGQNPNVIYLTDGVNSIRINMVSSVEVRNSATLGGVKVNVHCNPGGVREKVYTLILMQEN